MKKYFWEEDIVLTPPVSLSTDIELDIAIVGAGMTGISTAYQLLEQSGGTKKIAVFDQGLVGFGVTRGTTGKLTFLQDATYQKIKSNFGLQTAKDYLSSQLEAIEQVKKIVEKEKIACDLTKASSYIFTSKSSSDKKILKEKEVLDQLGVSSQIQTTFPHPLPIDLSLKVEDTYVFHPLKYLLALKAILENAGIHIYEQTQVTSFEQKESDMRLTAKSKKKSYQIRAKQIVLACHYPFFTIPGGIPFKTYLEKSSVVAFPTKKIQPSHAISIDSPTYSLRYHTGKEDYAIFLGSSHRLGHHLDESQDRALMFRETEQFFKKKPTYFWTNYDLLTSDGLPYIGKLSKRYPNLYIATGYSTWGMTNGTIAGKVLSDLILTGKSPYQSLFDPHRPLSLEKVVRFVEDNFFISKTYFLSRIHHNYDFYPNYVYTFLKKGIRYGVYIDEEQKKHTVTITCPHLFCHVHFNMVEKTWDCPCHGSRFDIDGNLIKGPSLRDITPYQKSTKTLNTNKK